MTALAEAVRGTDPHFAAAIRAVQEADAAKAELVRVRDELRAELRRVRRERDAALNRAEQARRSRDVWKQRTWDAEWALGIRHSRKVVAGLDV